MGGNRVTIKQGLIEIVADTTVDDTSYAPPEVWALPAVPTMAALVVVLEAQDQVSRMGVRVTFPGKLPGSDAVAWALEWVSYQGAEPVPLVWNVDQIANPSALNNLYLPVPNAIFRARLLATEPGKKPVRYPEATISTAGDTALSDNILSAAKKPASILAYSTITGEQAGIDAQAVAFTCTAVDTAKGTYDAAVTALTAYLTALAGWNVVPGSDVVIVGTTFRTKFTDITTARQALLNTISAQAKVLADAAQTGVNQINSVDYMVNQDKITLLNDWKAELQTQIQLDAQAVTLGVSSAAYDSAIIALSTNLIAAGAPAGWATSWPDGVTSGPWAAVLTNLRTWWTAIATQRATLSKNLTGAVNTIAASAFSLAPAIVADHTAITLPAAAYPAGKIVYQTGGTPPGTLWQVATGGASWITPSLATTQLVGTLVAAQISAGAIGAAALAATIVISNLIKSSDYTETASVPTAGFKLDSAEATYKLKVGAGWFGTAVRIGNSTATLGDTSARALTGIATSGLTATDVIWWRGNNDPSINGGAPIIIDPIWAKDATFVVGDRRMAGVTTGLPAYNTARYVYECTTAGAGLTTAQAASSAYSAATTYAAGNTVNSGSRIYSSKAAGNLNHTPTVGGDAYWTDLGSIYGPQGTLRTTDNVLDGAAKWKCVGWMWTNSVATAGCKPWARSAVVAVGDLMASDVGATLPGYTATAEKIYGQPVGAQYDPSSLTTNKGTTRIFRCVTAGTANAAGNGPTGATTGIADGTAIWDYWSENTGSEDRVQIWGSEIFGGNNSFGFEVRIQPKTNKDNLDALTHIEIEPLGADNTWRGRSDPHNQTSVTVPSRKYYSPSTPAHIGNMVRTSVQICTQYGSDTQCYFSGAPYGLQVKMRVRLHNIHGASSAMDYANWAGQNLQPTPYANTMSSAPLGGGGSGGGGACPEPWVMILTARGMVPAGEIVVGDVVITNHEASGEPGEWIVEAVSWDENETASLRARKTDTLGATSEVEMAFALNHRFLRDGGWVQLREIQVGAELASTDGSTITILAVEARGKNTVVKITVADAHTYSTEGVLSHNIKILN